MVGREVTFRNFSGTVFSNLKCSGVENTFFNIQAMH
jgi:hypothetical protein